MKKDKYKTDVVFRVDTKLDFRGTIFALFPHECCDCNGNVTTFQHVGQHSAANYNYCISISRPATKKECADLKKEMEGRGYNFNIVKRQNYKKWLQSYNEVKERSGIKKVS